MRRRAQAAALALALFASAGTLLATHGDGDSPERPVVVAGALDRLESDGRVILRGEDAGAWEGVNDGRSHGFGDFGVHVARKPILDPFLRSGRHLDTVHAATAPGRDGYGVTTTEKHVTERGTVVRQVLAAAGEPVLVVQTRTRRYERSLTVFAEVTFLPAAAGWYWKEPKWAAGPFVGRLATASVYDRRGAFLGRHDLSRYSDPTRHTQQLKHPERRSVVLDMGAYKVRVYASGLREGSFRGEDWQGGPGIDEIRRIAQGAEWYSRATVPAYCHVDPLRPTWEVVVWPDRATILLHGWTGGVGFHDCLPAYRSGRALAGRTFRNLLRLEW